jgi:hypothetical protein
MITSHFFAYTAHMHTGVPLFTRLFNSIALCRFKKGKLSKVEYEEALLSAEAGAGDDADSDGGASAGEDDQGPRVRADGDYRKRAGWRKYKDASKKGHKSSYDAKLERVHQKKRWKKN